MCAPVIPLALCWRMAATLALSPPPAPAPAAHLHCCDEHHDDVEDGALCDALKEVELVVDAAGDEGVGNLRGTRGGQSSSRAAGRNVKEWNGSSMIGMIMVGTAAARYMS